MANYTKQLSKNVYLAPDSITTFKLKLR